jgi:hypothetical protein
MQPDGKVWTMRESRPIVWARCGGRCEVSGQPITEQQFEAHHRRNKGMGGTSRPDAHAPWNLLALHPVVHNGGPQSVHGRRTWSEERGYLVEKHHAAPQHRPVLLYGRRWVLLREGAFYVALPV